MAEDIYKNLIDNKGEINLRIADFGCGPDGLFENRLAALVENREASGEVQVLALDVVELACAKKLTEDGAAPKDGIEATAHTKFICKTHAGDYGDAFLGVEPAFDAGVFCLSFMAADALEKGLLAASRVIKPKGTIYVVVDPWKLNINYAWKKDKIEEELQAWCASFHEKTGFLISKKCIKGSPKFVYLELVNVGLEERADLEERLEGVTMKALREAAEAPSQEPTPKKQELEPAADGDA